MMEYAIFDLDGTLADISHRVHLAKEKKWDEFQSLMHLDKIKIEVCNIMGALIAANYGIILITGRSESHRDVTTYWLYSNGIMAHKSLMMRHIGDHRPDIEVKLDHLCALNEAGIYPKIAFDDRDRVVEMWRSQGLTCFQVAKGDY